MYLLHQVPQHLSQQQQVHLRHPVHLKLLAHLKPLARHRAIQRQQAGHRVIQRQRVEHLVRQLHRVRHLAIHHHHQQRRALWMRYCTLLNTMRGLHLHQIQLGVLERFSPLRQQFFEIFLRVYLRHQIDRLFLKQMYLGCQIWSLYLHRRHQVRAHLRHPAPARARVRHRAQPQLRHRA